MATEWRTDKKLWTYLGLALVGAALFMGGFFGRELVDPAFDNHTPYFTGYKVGWIKGYKRGVKDTILKIRKVEADGSTVQELDRR